MSKTTWSKFANFDMIFTPKNQLGNRDSDNSPPSPTQALPDAFKINILTLLEMIIYPSRICEGRFGSSHL